MPDWAAGPAVFTIPAHRSFADALAAGLIQRFGKEPAQELEQEVLIPAPREVIVLDNDPNFPENGRLQLTMKGGM